MPLPNDRPIEKEEEIGSKSASKSERNSRQHAHSFSLLAIDKANGERVMPLSVNKPKRHSIHVAPTTGLTPQMTKLLKPTPKASSFFVEKEKIIEQQIEHEVDSNTPSPRGIPKGFGEGLVVGGDGGSGS
eukprot:CAMPEP_0170509062 /NCGR_PEP_ID=MMETSP0208-20121228/64261_1 /TAXON_ID=197538 /ORGANISM="Strombidium inclinatum, Strain S3" /LENGTH=129 /DNA_ID=CAMNT_0010792281 /DNA_START=637 /DNA_END=1023 /DNA_ORIENTATION=-